MNNTVYLVKTRMKVPKDQEYRTYQSVIVAPDIPAAVERFLCDWQSGYANEPDGTAAPKALTYFEVSVICPEYELTLPKN